MANVIRLVLSVVFGLVWIWIYDFTDFSWVVLLGSIVTLCVCCCRPGEEHGEWSWDHYFGCLRRCRTALLVWMVALFVVGALWPVVSGGPFPAGAALVTLAVGAIGSVWSIRLLCCVYH